MSERSMPVVGTSLDRALAFIEVYRHAPNDTDVEIRIGHMAGSSGTKTPAVHVTVGKSQHALTADEAATIADIFEDALNKYPMDPAADSLPNLILALRHGVKMARTEFPHHPRQVT